MKKLIYSMLAMALVAMTLTSCEDVPMPYGWPFENNENPTQTVEPKGDGTVENPFNVAGAENYIANGGDANAIVYVEGTISEIKSIDTSNYGNAEYFISDDGTTKGQFTVYRGYALGNKKFTSKDEIKIGDKVVVCGKLVDFNGTKEFTSGNYIYSQNGQTAKPAETNTPETAYTVAEAIAKIKDGTAPSDSVYVKGIISEVTSYNGDFKSITYYISDDGKSNDLQVYSGRGLNGAGFTSKEDLKVGQSVVIFGIIKDYNGKPEIDKENRLVSISGTGTPGSQESTAESPLTVAQAISLVTADPTYSKEVFVKGIISEIKSYNSKYKSITYFISDDGTTTSQLQIYSGKGKDGADFASQDDLKVGEAVVVNGLLKSYNGTPEIDMNSKIVTPGSTTPGTTEGIGTVSGNTITVKATDFKLENGKDMGTQTLADGTKLTFDKGTNNNAPKFYTAGDGTIRMYPTNFVDIVSGKKIASITLNCDSYNGTDYTAEGLLKSAPGTVVLDKLVYTVSGINATSLTLTNGAEGTGGTKQLRIVSMTITYAD